MKRVDATWNPISLGSEPEILARFYHHTEKELTPLNDGWYCFDVSIDQAQKLVADLSSWTAHQEDGDEVQVQVSRSEDAICIKFKSEREIYSCQQGLYDYKGYLDRHIIELTHQEAHELKQKLSAAIKSAAVIA